MTTHTLTSKDYDQGPKSFTLETADSYFIRETVAYVKGSPATHADAVTVIVWFHGFYVENRGNLFNDTKGQEVKLLANLESCSIQDLIFIAPFMGYVEPAMEFILDKDKQKIPLLDKDKKPIPGKFLQRHVGSVQYQGVEGTLGKAADDYLAKVLEGLANFFASKSVPLKRSDGKDASTFTIKNLILACHSGGGVAMRAFVGGLGQTNTAALKGCWCFDCLYGGDAANFWFNRSADKNAAPFYAYYDDTASNAKKLLALMGHPKETEFSQDKSSLNVIDNSGKSHYRTASEGFAERLNSIRLP